MSLRDEIFKKLKIAFNTYNLDSINYVTDDIISKIKEYGYISKEELEKRIDSEIEEIELDLGTTTTDDRTKIHYMTGCKQGLTKVKEMLK